MMPRVEVVMSTYKANPRWLREQLDSIWAQQDVDVTLLLRDDGSPDGTADLILELTEGRPARLVRGENVGAGRSFLDGLRHADPDVEYVAWADQDDVWRADKLARAVRKLRSVSSPSLYSARVELVDAQLEHLGLHPLPIRGHSFANALVQNAATGCTIVLDRAAVDLLVREQPDGIVLHDAWAYLVVSGCGSTVYDDEPVVLYRQHGTNVVGVAATPLRRWSGRIRRHVQSGHERVHTKQDRSLLRHYARDLRPDARWLLDGYLAAADGGLIRRATWAATGPPHRQDRLSDLVYRLLFVLGRV